VKPDNLKRSTKPGGQADFPISVSAQIGRKDKVDCENAEESQQVRME